jgi:hypothetical protein
MKTIIPPVLITFALVCFALVQHTQAVSPAPDGGYPGGNTAEGQNALLNLTSGGYNTAVGLFSLSSNTSGGFNTAIGAGALLSNTTGTENTAVGAGALLSEVTTGSNTAVGAFALVNNTDGVTNTAIGDRTLFQNNTGSNNTAMGFDALFNNTTGTGNTAIGIYALNSNTTGFLNIALGQFAGTNVTMGNHNIDIGNDGVAGESGTIRIGDVNQTTAFIAGIRGVTTGIVDAIPVLIDSAGQLGTMSSSQRFKKDIKPMDKASEAILALNPVTFEYKSDKANTPQFGLIAEQVAKANPDLVVRDKEGKPYSVRYDQVNAMLLNEFLKEHRKVEKLEASRAQQEKEIRALTASLKEQAFQIQKVSAQLEASKPAPQVVNNP